LLVTTAYRPSAALTTYARSLADRLNAGYVARGNDTLPRLRRKYGAQDILAVTEEGLRFYPQGGDDGRPLFFHPNMAEIRIKRLLRGEPDPMLKAADIRPGDAVLDCTAGMASDAIVFAHAVGPNGRVTALESERILHLIVSEGLQSYPTEFPALEQAMRRVELVRADHLTYLRRLDAGSFDVVYFE